MSQYIVAAARTQKEVLDGQCDVWETHCDTIKEAIARAQYVLTDEFQSSGEMIQPLGYSQVLKDGVCVRDFFRKEKREIISANDAYNARVFHVEPLA